MTLCIALVSCDFAVIAYYFQEVFVGSFRFPTQTIMTTCEQRQFCFFTLSVCFLGVLR